MCGIYCVYKQSRSCQLPFCASPIFHFEIGDFSIYMYLYNIIIIGLTTGVLLYMTIYFAGYIFTCVFF